MNTVDTKHKNLMFIGDIHGVDNLKRIVHQMVVRYKITDTALIVCGDCGFGFEKRGFYDNVYNEIKRRLTKNDIDIYLMRGNHDDPSYFNGEERYEKDRMHCLSDYSLICLENGLNVLCVGGAVSVDRKARREGASWWKGEQFVFHPDKIDEICESSHIDIVVTHTSPKMCPPFDNKGVLTGWATVDKNIIEDCDREREDVMRLYDYLVEEKHQNIVKWYYGHFHSHFDIKVNDCVFTGLDIEELVDYNIM